MASCPALPRPCHGILTAISSIFCCRDHSPKPFSRLEAFGATVCAAVVDCNAQLVVVLSTDGAAARFVAKYRPAVPLLVVTPMQHVVNQSSVVFGQYGMLAEDFSNTEQLIAAAKEYAVREKFWSGRGSTIVLHGKSEPAADTQPVFSVVE